MGRVLILWELGPEIPDTRILLCSEATSQQVSNIGMTSILDVLGDRALGMDLTGTITRWIKHKKFGFISTPGCNDDIFLVYKEWQELGFPCEGDSVSFTLGRNEKGWKALNCQRCSPDEVVPPLISSTLLPQATKLASDLGKTDSSLPSTSIFMALPQPASQANVIKFDPTFPLVSNPHLKQSADSIFSLCRSSFIQGSMSSSTAMMTDIPEEYKPSVASVDFFFSQAQVRTQAEACTDSLQFYRAMVKRSMTAVEDLSTSKNMGLIYQTEMERHVQDIDDNIFASFPAPEQRLIEARRDWKAILTLQNQREENRIKGYSDDTKRITIGDLKVLNGFKQEILKEEMTLARLRTLSPSSEPLPKSVAGILDVYNRFIAIDSTMPWYWKAGWMFFQIYRQRLLVKEDILNACILSNWVLIQHGLPFCVDYDYTLISREEDRTQREALSAETEGPYSQWILNIIANQFTDFECCCEELVQLSLRSLDDKSTGHILSSATTTTAAKSSSGTSTKAPAATSVPSEAALEQALISHRRHLKNNETCFICYDDSVKCTVSLLCCGQATHTKCIEKWYRSSNIRQGNEVCPKCRQNNPEPLISMPEGNDDDDDEDDDEYYSDEDEDEDYEAHGRANHLAFRFWANMRQHDHGYHHRHDDDDYYDEEDDDDDDSDYYRNEANPNQSYCVECDHRLRANACANGCCAPCCEEVACRRNPCERHGNFY